ncbi:MAG: glycosyltransferase family 4 protein [Rhodothermales bacterium]
MKLLFIAERFPPSVGGQQSLNYGIYQQFRKHVKTYLMTPGLYLWFNLHKLWFFPYVLLAGVALCARRNITHIHVSSARVAFLGYLVSRLFDVKLSVAVHGLDITLAGKFITYKYLAPYALRRYDAIICNSRATLEQCVRIGVDRARCHVVYPGVDVHTNGRGVDKPVARAKLKEHAGVDVIGKTVITTVGRLVRRKGVAWFVDRVVPLLPPHFVYLVLGSGAELGRIREIIRRRQVASRVHLLIDVPDALRDLVYDAADVFVMPNIRVPGDREGFGIVNLEAGMHDLPVVASGIEGIRDAVIDGVTGCLVEDGNPSSFVEGLHEVLSWDAEPGRISAAVRATYSLEASYRAYEDILGLAVAAAS